jgi:hypothetical protein
MRVALLDGQVQRRPYAFEFSQPFKDYCEAVLPYINEFPDSIYECSWAEVEAVIYYYKREYVVHLDCTKAFNWTDQDDFCIACFKRIENGKSKDDQTAE